MQAYGMAADVFSFGVVLWELVTLERPWRDDPGPSSTNGCDPQQHFRDPLLFVIASVPQGGRLDLPEAPVEPPLPELPEVRAGAWCQHRSHLHGSHPCCSHAWPCMAHACSLKGVAKACKRSNADSFGCFWCAQVLQLIRDCWEQEPARRPTMAAVVARLEGILGAIKARQRSARSR